MTKPSRKQKKLALELGIEVEPGMTMGALRELITRGLLGRQLERRGLNPTGMKLEDLAFEARRLRRNEVADRIAQKRRAVRDGFEFVGFWVRVGDYSGKNVTLCHVESVDHDGRLRVCLPDCQSRFNIYHGFVLRVLTAGEVKGVNLPHPLIEKGRVLLSLLRSQKAVERVAPWIWVKQHDRHQKTCSVDLQTKGLGAYILAQLTVGEKSQNFTVILKDRIDGHDVIDGLAILILRKGWTVTPKKDFTDAIAAHQGDGYVRLARKLIGE